PSVAAVEVLAVARGRSDRHACGHQEASAGDNSQKSFHAPSSVGLSMSATTRRTCPGGSSRAGCELPPGCFRGQWCSSIFFMSSFEHVALACSCLLCRRRPADFRQGWVLERAEGSAGHALPPTPDTPEPGRRCRSPRAGAPPSPPG